MKLLRVDFSRHDHKAHSATFKNKTSLSLTIGAFDGLHRGHQALLKMMDGEERVVLSFYPPPAQLLGKRAKVPGLSSFCERIKILEQFGITQLVMARFTKKFSELSAEDFISKIVVGHFAAQELVVGEDAAFGCGRRGDIDFLRSELPRLGVKLKVAQFLNFSSIDQHQIKISSGHVRQALLEANLALVEDLLGRSYVISGRIVPGAARGGKIGFPTLNLGSISQLLPKAGVYATNVIFNNKRFLSVTNLGYAPTFDRGTLKVESHIINKKDLANMPSYGDRVAVEFVSYLREERKFATVDDLIKAIKEDIQRLL
jgi:riboflavin kinase/FMN adenylyltransferase